jgi:integrase
VTIGDARRVNLKAARAEAEKRFAQITLGHDPQAEKQAAKERAAITVGPLIDKYLSLKQGRVRKNTIVADQRYLTGYWKPLRRLPIDAVTRRTVAVRLNEITTERGATAAARARQSLSAFFAWAIREGVAEANPVIGTNDPAGYIDARDRVLSNAELRAIWLHAGPGDFGRIIRLLILTGCRRDEIGGLQWCELDLDQGVLAIPGARTKNHHALQLTLPPQAVSLLKETPRKADRDYVFGSSGGPFSRWSWEKQSIDHRILKAGEAVDPWRIHDLRRTVATGMAEIGISPHIIEAVLNHRSGHKAGVAGIYNRASYEREICDALSRWAEHVTTVVIDARSNIVALRHTA